MISIITPTTTGGLSHLVNLVPTIEQQSVPYEFILIDNSSRDGTTNYLGSHDCIMKINKVKMNFSESNNYGSKISQGEYLLFLNNDTKLEQNTLEEMLKVFNEDEKIGVVGCQIRLMSHPHRIQHAGVMLTDKYEPYELGLSQPFGVPELPANDPRVVSVREVPSVTACCMMVKKSVFQEVGGFDTRFINGWEDSDINLRIRELGYKIYYTGKTAIYHNRFGSRDRGRFLFEKENRDLYEEIWMKTDRAKKVLGEFRQS